MKRGGELIYAGPLGSNSCKLVEFFEVCLGMFFKVNTRCVIEIFLFGLTNCTVALKQPKDRLSLILMPIGWVDLD